MLVAFFSGLYAILKLYLMLIEVCENLLVRMWGNSPSGVDPTHWVFVNR